MLICSVKSFSSQSHLSQLQVFIFFSFMALYATGKLSLESQLVETFLLRCAQFSICENISFSQIVFHISAHLIDLE